MPVRPTELADLPAQMDDFLSIAMAKDRNLRFQSGVELRRAFTLAVEGQMSPVMLDRARGLQRSKPWEDADPITLAG